MSPLPRTLAALTVLAALLGGCTPSNSRSSSIDKSLESAAVAAGPTMGRQAWGDKRRYIYGVDPTQNYGDLSLPDRAPESGTLPLVVFIHGGSWSDGVGAQSVAHQVESLRREGVAVWNIEYRRVGSGGGWPTTFLDVATAFDFLISLRDRAPEIDLGRVVVSGHSAGGQLAAWLAARGALHDEEIGARPRLVPRGLLTINGVLDMAESAVNRRGGSQKILGGLPKDVPERYFSVDPYGLVEHTANVIAVQGTKDTMVLPAQAVDYVKTVNYFSRSNKAALMMLPGADHVSPMVAQWPQVKERIVTFAKSGFDAAAAGLPRPQYSP